MGGLVYNINHSTGRGLTAIEISNVSGFGPKCGVRPFGANRRDTTLAKLYSFSLANRASAAARVSSFLQKVKRTCVAPSCELL
jgi:hypothetical protein